MASKMTVERKIYYGSAIDKTNVDGSFGFGAIYCIGHSDFSSTSSHSKGVKDNIPPYSIINSTTMGVDSGTISITTDGLDGSYSWRLIIEAYYRYVTSEGDNSSKYSGSLGNTNNFRESGNPNSFSNFSSVVSKYKYGTASDFSSGTENAGLLKAFDINNSYTNEETSSLRFYWEENGLGLNASALSIKNSQPYITYEITLPTITLLSNNLEMGTVNGAESDNIYNIDVSSSYSVTAEPKPGYRFVKWSDGNEERIRTFTKMDLTSSNTEITAEFIPYYTISYNLNGGNTSETRINFYDSLYGALDSNLSPTGVSEIIIPTPLKTGYTFIGWTGTDIEEPSMVINIPLGSSGNRTYTANWQINQYKVTINCSPEDSGIATIILKDGTEFSNSSKLLDYGTSLTAISATTTDVDKYEFSEFTITGKTPSLNNTLYGQVVPAQDIAYIAYFDLKKYAVTASSVLISYDEDGNEIETQDDCAVFELNNLSTFTPQEYGKSIYISFLPKFGYKFVKWKNTETSKMNKAVLETVVTGEIKAVACFEKIEPTNNSIPDNVENLPLAEKEKLITSIADSIINKTIINYINTVKMNSIGDYIFYNCDKLKFINIPNVNPSALGSYAFYGCKNLTSLRLPENITELKDHAFENCINLTTLIIPNSSLVELTGQDVFWNTPFCNSLYNQPFGYIYVPEALISDYKTRTNWVLYAERFRPIEEYSAICGVEE